MLLVWIVYIRDNNGIVNMEFDFWIDLWCLFWEVVRRRNVGSGTLDDAERRTVRKSWFPRRTCLSGVSHSTPISSPKACPMTSIPSFPVFSFPNFGI